MGYRQSTGSLIARFGVFRIMLASVTLFADHVIVTQTSTRFGTLVGALVVLGVGWNFLDVSGTTQFTATYPAAEKVARRRPTT